jgi:hypothetical protein
MVFAYSRDEDVKAGRRRGGSEGHTDREAPPGFDDPFRRLQPGRIQHRVGVAGGRLRCVDNTRCRFARI